MFHQLKYNDYKKENPNVTPATINPDNTDKQKIDKIKDAIERLTTKKKKNDPLIPRYRIKNNTHTIGQRTQLSLLGIPSSKDLMSKNL